jgi:hypothetical protein
MDAGRRPDVQAGSCYPSDLDYSLPQIRVVGSFVAKRMPDDLKVINQPGRDDRPSWARSVSSLHTNSGR